MSLKEVSTRWPRGTLRIYVGAAPGVGKTFAMLNEGWRRKERGTDVVVGFVETHGRALTAAQLRDLEVVPRRTIEYRGRQFEEMDLDAVLARAPKVALVDELAHTNVPGCRNDKRWQDIDELLAAGIDVISTVNIQHLESLNDVVERITGDRPARDGSRRGGARRRPDRARRHDSRRRCGDAWRTATSTRPRRSTPRCATTSGVGNLGALRELALLWVADRVDESLEEYRERHGITEPWETRERVVVALPARPAGSASFDAARGWRPAPTPSSSACTSATSDGLASADDGLLERHRGLLDELGGRFAEVAGADPRMRSCASPEPRTPPRSSSGPRNAPDGPSSPRDR